MLLTMRPYGSMVTGGIHFFIFTSVRGNLIYCSIEIINLQLWGGGCNQLFFCKRITRKNFFNAAGKITLEYLSFLTFFK